MCSKIFKILIFICSAELIAANSASYFWQVTLKQQLDDLTLKTLDIISNAKPINLTDTVNIENILPFSELDQNEIVNQQYAGSAYVIEVAIVDYNDQINHTVMRQVLLSGGSPPDIQLTYIHGSNSLDSGTSKFCVTGTIITADTSDEKLSNFSWHYSIPVNKYSTTIYVDLDELMTGATVVNGISKVFHLNLFGNNWDTSNENIDIEPTFQPFHLHPSTTVVSIADKLVISSNEFESSVVKKIPDHNSAVSCLMFDAVLQLSEFLLHFTQSGVYLLEQGSNNWMKISDLKCPTQISMSVHDTDFIVVTVNNEIYESKFEGNVTEFHFKLVKDTLENTWCEFIELPQCRIVGHTFPVNKCCMFYVLTYDELSEMYIVGQYTGISSDKGEWKILHTFHSKIPTSKYKHVSSGFVFMDSKSSDNGESMDLNGIQTLSLSDESLYLYGKIFLILDIRSCNLLVVQPEQNTLLFGNPVLQMSSAEKTRKFSLLTSDGKIWSGNSESSFAGIKLKNVGNTDIGGAVAVFFNFQDDLFVLELDRNKLKRRMIEERGKIEPQSFVTPTISCPDAAILSRVRKFHFEPPRIWPGESTNIIRDNEGVFPFAETNFFPYSENLFSLHRVSTQMVYTAQKIGQYNWWGNRITGDWYFNLHGFEDFLSYLSLNNLSHDNKSVAYFSKYDYELDSDKNNLHCSVFLPTTVYLDKGQIFKVEFTLTPGPNDPLSILANSDLFVSLSNHQLVDLSVVKYKESMHTRFEITFTGNQLDQLPPGVKLSSVFATISPWVPKFEHKPEGLNIVVKVGCPPAFSLEFDRAESVRMLAARGRTDNFECLYDLGDDIPCFTTSEFVTAFTVQDHVSGTHSPFRGNFTLKIVAGGVGYVENVRSYSEDEVAMFNYRPGDSKLMESLIWSVLDDSDDESMKDNATGELIFDSNNPSSIVFECRINSPCGSIPFGTKNPSEFFFVIETSNKGVDTSTNCDFTMRFVIHLIGIELNPRSHFSIMLVVLSILVTSIFLYYQLSTGSGNEIWKKFMRKMKKEKFSEPPLHLRNILQMRNEDNSVSSVLQNPIRNARRGSLLADSLMAEGKTRRKSIAVVADLRRQSFAMRGPSIVLNDDTLEGLDISERNFPSSG